MSNVRVNLGLVVGRDATINRLPEISISGGDGVRLTQNNDTFHMEADTTGIQSKLNGQPGQYISFDANGSMIPVDKPFELYGFEFDNLESNPESKIRYFGDNANYTPARMGSSSFDYGDWGNAFFIKNLRPCMVKYDGTVAYDLDKNDYSKKADGTASDIDNESFAGNAMVGIPTVWIKIDNTNANLVRVYVASKQLDDTYHAYAHHDNSGNIMPYTYLPIYNGWVDSSGRLRSLSGKAPTVEEEIEVLINKCRDNSSSAGEIWDTDRYVDRNLINLLLMLISKSTNTKAAFGNGNTTGNTNPASGSGTYGIMPTGTLDSSGLFWGSTTETNLSVKVFGMENWWGNIFRVMVGAVLRSKKFYYKLTKGTEDGSSVYGFNTDDMSGTAVPGWIDSGVTLQDEGFLNSVAISDKAAIIPVSASLNTSSTTYMCDFLWFNDSTSKTVALVGGTMASDICAGAFAINMMVEISGSGWFIGASCSCKPNVS